MVDTGANLRSGVDWTTLALVVMLAALDGLPKVEAILNVGA